EFGGRRRGAERRVAGFQRGLDRALEVVGARAELAAWGRRQAAQGLHRARDAALLAKGCHGRGIERGEVGRLLDSAERFPANRGEIVHPSYSEPNTKKGSLRSRLPLCALYPLRPPFC